MADGSSQNRQALMNTFLVESLRFERLSHRREDAAS
jgi:hypothetical protein